MNNNIDVKKIFINSFRLFFAPVIGAYKGIVCEYHHLQKEHTQ